jgi:hypothetical protein
MIGMQVPGFGALAPPSPAAGMNPAAIADGPTSTAMNPGAGKRTMIGMSVGDLGLPTGRPAGGQAGARPASVPPAATPVAGAGAGQGLAGTQIMHAYKPPAAGAAGGNGGAKKTMIGVVNPLQAPSASNGPRLAKNGTMIGVANPLAAGGGAAAMNKTMPLGVYQPSPARKTLLGVPVPAFIAPQTEYVEEEYEEIVPETGQLERRVRVVAVPPPPLYKRPAVYVLLAAVLIGIGGVVAVLVAPKAAPLRGEARVDASGNDVLHVTCEGCPDGTKLLLTGGTPTEVTGHEADLAVPAPLKIGDNQLDVAIDRPAAGRDETLRLTVPIAYRLKPDLSPLQGPTPAVHILVEATPGSTATVMGKQVTLGPDGKGTHVIDLRDELTGPSPQAKQITREVPYTVAVPGQSPESGKVSLRVGVPALMLESPTGNMVTDAATFTVAGSTAKGAGVSVAGHPLSVDAQGRFSQLMNISSEGTTDAEIRATAPPLAPRIVKIHVRRVASLAAEAKQREAQLKATYADVLAEGAGAAGKAILWKASVLEIAGSNTQRIAVVEVTSGCTKKPCLARLTVPGAAGLAKGDVLTIAGNILGAVSVRGSEVPDIEAEFVVKGP